MEGDLIHIDEKNILDVKKIKNIKKLGRLRKGCLQWRKSEPWKLFMQRTSRRWRKGDGENEAITEKDCRVVHTGRAGSMNFKQSRVQRPQ